MPKTPTTKPDSAAVKLESVADKQTKYRPGRGDMVVVVVVVVLN